MKIPFDKQQQIHLEYDGYQKSVIKQADVVLLGYPLLYPMSDKVRESDLDFYSQVTSAYGPAMTWSVTAIGYLEVLSKRLGDFECGRNTTNVTELHSLAHKAAEYFHLSYQNAQPPYYIWTETPKGVSRFSYPQVESF